MYFTVDGESTSDDESEHEKDTQDSEPVATNGEQLLKK